MSRLCPDCRQPLHCLNCSGLPVSSCRECGGLWFDTGGLRGLLRMGAETIASVERQSRPRSAVSTMRAGMRLCPNCDTPLSLCHYGHGSGVELDTCDACRGAWVEAGELDGIRRWLISCNMEPLAAEPRLTASALVA